MQGSMSMPPEALSMPMMTGASSKLYKKQEPQLTSSSSMLSER